MMRRLLTSRACRAAAGRQLVLASQQSRHLERLGPLAVGLPPALFLRTYASKAEGEIPWITTPSGLQYRDTKVGDGEAPAKGQTVYVHYTGQLENGQIFDSSIPRGEPLEFPVGTGKVIPGWDEGILSMRVGGKRQLKIPPELGYGRRGTPGGPIPPNATLLFDCELVKLGNKSLMSRLFG